MKVEDKIDNWLKERFKVDDVLEIIEDGKKISEYRVVKTDDNKMFLGYSKDYFYSPYYSEYYIMWGLMVNDLQWRLKMTNIEKAWEEISDFVTNPENPKITIDKSGIVELDSFIKRVEIEFNVKCFYIVKDDGNMILDIKDVEEENDICSTSV